MEGSAEGMRTLWISIAVLGLTALIQAAVAALSGLHRPDVQRRLRQQQRRARLGPLDSRSQAVISRAEYIRRHAECTTEPQGPAHVEDATPGPPGAWLAHYEIGGQQLTDYWFYVGRRWLLDLLLSNPSAAGLYRLPFAKYAGQTGCQIH